MKIDGIGPHGRSERPASTERREEGARSERTDGPSGDRIEVSLAARRMARLVDAAGRLPELRAPRVDALRDALRGGTYDVEPRALARSILEFEDGLFR